MPILYSHPISQHCRRVLALLDEAGIPFENRHVSLDEGEHMSPDYLAVNPNHQVPTLIDGDLVIHESNAILRYLCDKHELDTWYPRDIATRAAADQWLDWTQTRLGARNVFRGLQYGVCRRCRGPEGGRDRPRTIGRPVAGVERRARDKYLCRRLC